MPNRVDKKGTKILVRKLRRGLELWADADAAEEVAKAFRRYLRSEEDEDVNLGGPRWTGDEDE
jgi:hypothetical protein